MIGAPVQKSNPAKHENSTAIMPVLSNKNKSLLNFPPVINNESDMTGIKINNAYTLLPQYRSAQNIAIHAGLPTFVSTYYNPSNQIRNISVGTAAMSGVIGGFLGMGAEIYDEWSGADNLNYVRIAQTGSLLGMATASGVLVGQAVQKSLLTNSYMLWGSSSGALSSQIISGFTGDALGSGAAAFVYASGAYIMGWVDPADARTAMAKGATGALIMSAGKAAGTQAFLSVAGASGSFATLGPYAITYFAAVGAVYLTDWIFEGIDKQEENDRITHLLKNLQK